MLQSWTFVSGETESRGVNLIEMQQGEELLAFAVFNICFRVILSISSV